MQTDRRTANIDRDSLSLIFERVSVLRTKRFTLANIGIATRKGESKKRR